MGTLEIVDYEMKTQKEKEENDWRRKIFCTFCMQIVCNPYLSTFSGTLVSKEEIRNKNSMQHTVSWSKSLPITVLAFCIVFFSPNFTFVVLSFGCSAPTQWLLLTVFAKSAKNEFLNKAIHHSFWLFMSPILSVPPKRSEQWWWNWCTKKCKYERIHHLLLLICLFVFLPDTNGRVENNSWCMSFVQMWPGQLAWGMS